MASRGALSRPAGATAPVAGLDLATKDYVDSRPTTLRGATDYDDTMAPTDRQAILWVAAGSKFVPQTIQLADVDGLVSGLAGKQPLDTDLTVFAGLTVVNDSVLQGKAGAWAVRTPAQLKTDLTLVKSDVGLSNVDNTADTAKPVSTAQQTALDGKQTLDADLTAIAALAPSNDDVLQRKSGAWTNRTMAQLRTDLVVQPLDSDLTTIAGLTAITDSVLQAKAGAWAARTLAQLRADLDVGAIAVRSVDDTTATNSATMAADPGPQLSVPVAADAIYVVDLNVVYTSPIAAGLKQDFVAPSGAVISALTFVCGGATPQHGASTFTNGQILGIVGTAGPTGLRLRGLLVTAGTSGSLTWRRAQNTANAGTTTIHAGSTLEITRKWA